MTAVLQLLARRFAARRAPQPTTAASISTIRWYPGTAPLVLDSPHSGVAYPADFGHCLEPATLRRAEDTHVEKLFDFATALGASWIEALFPRSYIDVNRGLAEVDTSLLDGDWPGPLERDPKALAKVRLGKGLIWRCTDDGTAIYDRRLTVAEVQARIEACWRPYHQALAHTIDQAHQRHGYSIHLNCHSMPAMAASHATEFPGLAHADFVVGDRDGTTADPRLSNKICNHLRSLGYSVEYNHPYKGVELVRRYSNPALHRHSIQLEVNRRLYMDEQSLRLNGGFARLRIDLESLVLMLLATDPRSAWYLLHRPVNHIPE